MLDLGNDYYPIKLGAYSVYYTQDTTYLLSGPQVDNYYLRELVIDSVMSSDQSEVVYTLERSRKEMLSDDRWLIDSIWTVRVSSSRIVKTENNVPFVKLVFPIEHEKTWDGNSFNTQGTLLYEYSNVLTDTVMFDTLSYSNLWTVVQKNEPEDFLGRDFRKEVYAPQSGMILKVVSDWDYDQSAFPDRNIINGRGFVQTLIVNGEE